MVFINLIADANQLNEGWDHNLKKIELYSYAKSVITVIQGALQKDNSTNKLVVRNDFTAWINEVKEQLS